MERYMRRKIFPAVILISSVSIFISLPQPFPLVCGAIQMFLLPGLVFVHFFLKDRFSKLVEFCFSILLSPILITLLILGVNTITGNVPASTRISLAVFYSLFVVAFITRSREAGNEKGLPRAVPVIGLVFAGIVLVSYLVNGFLLIRSDSWYHACVVKEVVNRGIPPREPFLADLPIRYMWFYHLFQAAWMKMSGLSLFWAMGSFNVINAFLFPCLIGKFISRFTGKGYKIVTAAALAVAGLESASWIFVPAGLLRAFFGEVRGLDEVRRMISGLVINGSDVILTLTPYGAWMINLYDKFITVTAFGYSANLFLAAAILALSGKLIREEKAKSFAAAFFVILGTLLFHAVTGMALLGTIIGSAVLIRLFGGKFMKERKGEGKYILLLAALLAAGIGLPYILSLGAAGAEEGQSFISKHLHFSLRSLLTVVLPLIVLFSFARRAFRKLSKRVDYRAAVLFSWTLVLFMISLLINLPTVNESKFLFPLFFIMGPPIYIEIAESIKRNSGAKRALIIAAVALLFFVPWVLTVRGFMIQKPDRDLYRQRSGVTSQDMRVFDWITENTPEDAVVAENNVYHLVPVYGNRRNLYSNEGVIRVLGYHGEKMELFGRIQDFLYRPEELPEAAAADIKSMDQPLYVAVWREDLESRPWLAERFSAGSEFFRPVFESKRVSLYAFKYSNE